MKYYLRDGRKFVKTDGLYGMYANTDGTFTPKRVGNSYGVVVIHNFKEIVIAHLEVIPNITWYTAIKEYNPPTRLQLFAAYNLKHMFEPTTEYFWTKEESDSGYYAWYVNWRNGFVDGRNKRDNLYIREFTTIKL